MRSRLIAVLYVFFAFIFVCISSAQTFRGSIQGTITDSTGAAIPGKANENAPGATGAVAGTAAPAARARPDAKPAAAIDAVNLPALVNALLKKGVLTSSEVDALRLAAPESELQLLVEVLTRKGVLNAADLSAAAVPAGSPVPAPTPQAAPVPRSELAETKPAVVSAVPASVPLRALAFDPPQSGGLVGLKVGPVTFTPYGFIKATAEQDSSCFDETVG